MSNFPFSCINWHFLKITVLTFFIISLVIFGLQRRTLSQIKALEILFWPCFIIFSPMINICWAIMSRLCIILWTFFYPPFIFEQRVHLPCLLNFLSCNLKNEGRWFLNDTLMPLNLIQIFKHWFWEKLIKFTIIASGNPNF